MNTPLRSSVRRFGWTLQEVLVVVAVIGTLIALLVPAVQRAREAANRAACANHLKQLALAVHTCSDATGKLPPYSTGQPGTTIFGGWWIHLMPYASETTFHERLSNASGDSAFPKGTVSTIVAMQPEFRERRFALLTCPSDPTLGFSVFADGTSNYLANWFVFGDSVSGCYAPAQRMDTIRNGLSNGILFAEGYSTCNKVTREALIACATHNFGITWHGKPSDDPSYQPTNYMMFQTMPQVHGGACDTLRSQTPHTQMPTAFADGTVRFIGSDVSPALWTSMMKPRDLADPP